jgi:hypothetical protein
MGENDLFDLKRLRFLQIKNKKKFACGGEMFSKLSSAYIISVSP